MDKCLSALHARSNCSFILMGRNGKMNDIRHDAPSLGTLNTAEPGSRVCVPRFALAAVEAILSSQCYPSR